VITGGSAAGADERPAAEGPSSVAPDADRDPVRVALVEDHHLVREGIRMVLTANGFEVVAESSNIRGVFGMIGRHLPDVMLLDLTLADGDGVALLRDVHSRWPDMRVIVLTMHRDPETVRQALLAGADGYVIKGARSTELLEAIHAVMRGERYLHSSVTSIVVDDSIRWLRSGNTLSPREREILTLLAGEATTGDIGRRLGISPHTVRRHISNLSEKLGTRGTPALVRYAVREGLVRDIET
jgi:DNA-binding NarL/FixJ family response regulator